MRLPVRALALAGAVVGFANICGSAWAVDNCICMVSEEMRRGARPASYEYRACFRDGGCEEWTSITFDDTTAYSIKNHCNSGSDFVRFQVRFGREGREPGQTMDLARSQTFKDVNPTEVPSCACMPQAQYHFVKVGGKTQLRNGLPRNITLRPCRQIKVD